MDILEEARLRRTARQASSVRRVIDYDRMNRILPIQKAMLTRAVNRWRALDSAFRADENAKGVPLYLAQVKIAEVCKAAIAEWTEIGAWPDAWHSWNIALRDATGLEMDDLR